MIIIIEWRELIWHYFLFSLLNKSIEVAEDIASKSPVAVQGSKISLVYSRDHSVQEGLDHIVSAFFYLFHLKLYNKNLLFAINIHMK